MPSNSCRFTADQILKEYNNDVRQVIMALNKYLGCGGQLKYVIENEDECPTYGMHMRDTISWPITSANVVVLAFNFYLRSLVCALPPPPTPA